MNSGIDPLDQGGDLESPLCDRPSISQQLLQEFLAARKTKVQAEREYEALRHQLLAFLYADMGVEPGPLSVELKILSRLNLSQSNIIEAFGPEEFERIAAGIKRQTCEHVIVRSAPAPRTGRSLQTESYNCDEEGFLD